MKIISFLAQKGGNAKTTSAAAVGQLLNRTGNRVLFIDLDPQGDLADTLGGTGSKTILNVLKGDQIQDATIATPYGDLLQSDAELNLYKLDPETILRAIRSNAQTWDYCIIDNPPELSAITAASIYAADYIVMPAQAERFSIKALSQLFNTIDTIRSTTGHAGRVLGVLITRYNNRAIISRQARQFIQDTARAAGTDLFNTEIRECTAIKEAQAEEKDIYTYAPKSNAATDYRSVTSEMLERIHAAETGSK